LQQPKGKKLVQAKQTKPKNGKKDPKAHEATENIPAESSSCFEEAGDIGPVEIAHDEIGPANRTGRNRTLRNRPTLEIFLKRSYFSVKMGLFLPIISKFHEVL
jgi:hypothetical protein